MRVFVAIDINDGMKKALEDLQRQLISKADVKKSDVKWVRPDNIHLTLKFLGEVGDEKIVEVCDIIKEVSGRHKGFDLNIESVGHFGGKSARVLWVGTGEGQEQLFQLQQDIEQRLATAGWPKEQRQFTGHLTLCRIRNSKAGVKLAQVGQQYKNFKLGVISADSVRVYQSQLEPTGPVYTVLGDYKLQ